MSISDATTDKEQSIAEIHQLIGEQVYQAHKEEVFDVYETFLAALWQCIFPTLGEVTLTAIVQRALVLTIRKYPQIHHVTVLDNGFDFSTLRQHADTVENEVLCNALKELNDNLLNILTMLTGDILLRQLIRELKRNL